MMNKKKLIRELVKSTDNELGDEQLIHLLLESKVSLNVDAQDEKGSFGQRAADAVAKFAGSWGFIGSFLGVMLIWIVLNVVLYSIKNSAFDPYPFILLNLLLSCVAAVQAPLIMMSQNRQEQKDRARAENDYKVNLKNELILSDLHEKIDLLIKNQERILKHIDKN